jgi:hypothetical protein
LATLQRELLEVVFGLQHHNNLFVALCTGAHVVDIFAGLREDNVVAVALAATMTTLVVQRMVNVLVIKRRGAGEKQKRAETISDSVVRPPFEQLSPPLSPK